MALSTREIELVNGDELLTQYVPFAGYGPFPENTLVQDNILEVKVDDNLEFRQFATVGLARNINPDPSNVGPTRNVQRQAILTAPNLLLCGGSVVVHIVDNLQVPAIAYFPTIEDLICASPQFSVLCEACAIVGAADEAIGQTFRTCTPPGYIGANGLNIGYCGYAQFNQNNFGPPGGLVG